MTLTWFIIIVFFVVLLLIFLYLRDKIESLKSKNRRIQDQIKDSDEVSGNRVKVKVVKNKLAPPFRLAEFDIMFGEGISKVGEIIDMGVELGILQKSGSWFAYNDSKIGQGRDAVKTFLHDNPEVAEEIEGRIREQLQVTEEV